MNSIEQLPDIERELLRHLFQSPDHTGSAETLCQKTYYPNDEVVATLTDLQARGLIESVDSGLKPAPAMLTQMQRLEQRANGLLSDAARDATKKLKADEG